MKKFNKLFITLALVAILCFSLAMVGCKKEQEDDKGVVEKTYELAENQQMIWLDRYDEADIVLKSGDKEKLSWTSGNESVVTVASGRLVAMGKGETQVTISDGKFSDVINVKVRDSGTKPRFGFKAVEAYLNVPSKLPNQISYNAKIYTPDLTYTVSVEDATLAVFENNQIKGLKKGQSKITITTTYKGVKIEKTMTIEVVDSLRIAFESENAEIYAVKGKKSILNLNAKVLDMGKDVENANIVYSVEKGEEFVTLEGDVLTAKKQGEAIVKASYTKGDATVETYLDVTIHSNYKETEFTDPGSEKITFEKFDGEIGGRKGDILHYMPGENVNGGNCFNHRIVEKHYGDGILGMYKEGYRYFSYDLYYTGSQNLMIGCHTTTAWIGVGQTFRTNFMKISADGEMINRLEKNRWITITYDFRELWMESMGIMNNFFFFINEKGSSAYIMNARLYLDDAFLPDENISYERKDGFIQATNDEFDVKNPVSTGYVEGNPDPGIVIKPEEVPTYAPYEGEIGGRTGVYQYKTMAPRAGLNSLVVASSMNRSYSDSRYILNKRGKFLAFDMYVKQGSMLKFEMNGGNTSATVKLNESVLGKYEDYFVVLKDGKKQSEITEGNWYTVVYKYAENYLEDVWSCEITLTATGANDIIYLDNVRYYKDGSFIPEEYEAERNAPYVKQEGSATITRVTDGEFKGAYKYENKGNLEATNGMYFSEVTTNDNAPGKFFTDGFKFVKFDLYIGGNANKLAIRATGEKNFTNYVKENIVVGTDFADNEILVFDETNTKATKFVGGNWYTVYIPVKTTAADMGKVSVSVTAESGDGSPATIYARYVSYAYEFNGLYLMNNAHSAYVELSYLTEGENKNSFKYVNKTSGDVAGNMQNWGEAGVNFDRVTLRNNTGGDSFFREGCKFIKVGVKFEDNVQSFTIRATADRNFTDYWPVDIPVNSILSYDNVYMIEEDGSRAEFVSANTWYTLYIPIEYTELDIGNAYVMIFTNGGSTENPSVMYLKDIEYLVSADIPKVAPYEFWAKSGDLQKSYIERIKKGEMAGMYKYVNKTAEDDNEALGSYGSNGFGFLNVCNKVAMTGPETCGPFFKDNKHFIKFDMFVESATSLTFKLFGQKGFAQKWNRQVRPGDALPEYVYLINANGERVRSYAIGNWYTCYIRVDYNAGYADWTEVTVYTNGGSVENPAVMYLKGLETLASVDIPEFTPYDFWSKSDKFDQSYIEKVESGENMGAYKYVNFTAEDDNEVLESYGSNGFGFLNVCNKVASTGPETCGPFFKDNKHFIKFDMFVESATSLTFKLFGQNGFVQKWNRQVKPGDALPEYVYLINANGERVASYNLGEWYTCYIRVDYNEGYADWTEVTVYTNGGSTATPAVMYMKNLETLKTAEIPELKK